MMPSSDNIYKNKSVFLFLHDALQEMIHYGSLTPRLHFFHEVN